MGGRSTCLAPIGGLGDSVLLRFRFSDQLGCLTLGTTLADLRHDLGPASDLPPFLPDFFCVHVSTVWEHLCASVQYRCYKVGTVLGILDPLKHHPKACVACARAHSLAPLSLSLSPSLSLFLSVLKVKRSIIHTLSCHDFSRKGPMSFSEHGP